MAFKLPGLSRGGSQKASLNADTILESGDPAHATTSLPFLAGKSAAEQLRLLRIPFLIFAALTIGFVLYQIR
ncbi:MAG TPA: hypothetical protein PLM62_05125, partial [Zoogloea sp.]|nr:hypothetical protein [Zoogloea sp.]